MAEKTNFQKRLKELEDIIEWFEREDVDLDEAVAKFEEGLKIASELKKHLETIQAKVKQIKLRFDNSQDNTAA